jgi:hypothetical protein
MRASPSNRSTLDPAAAGHASGYSIRIAFMRAEHERRRGKTKQIQEGLQARQMTTQGNALGYSFTEIPSPVGAIQIPALARLPAPPLSLPRSENATTRELI